MNTDKIFRGTAVALVTPFNEDGSIDEESLRNLVEFHIVQGTRVIIPCGTTGESATLSHTEHHQVMDIVMDCAGGRIPVIVGAGSNSTREAISLTQHAKAIGAKGVLSIAPYYNKPTQDGFYQHFRAIAEAVDIPIIMYNVPGRTGSNMNAETTLRIAEQVPNIVGIKEASGNLAQIMEILRNRPENFAVYSGDDALTLAILALGGDGVISVVANEAPRMMGQMVNACLEGDFNSARHLHYKLLPLMNINFIESNPIPVKAALAMMGIIKETYRLPLTPMSESNKSKLRKILDELHLVETTSTISV